MATDALGTALGRMEERILPELAALIGGLVDSAALARPGVDSEACAAELRALTAEVEKLAAEVEMLCASASPTSRRRSASAA